VQSLGNGTAFSALGHLRSGPQSQPIDPEMFGTKTPPNIRDNQHPTFQMVPVATAPFILPLLDSSGSVLCLPQSSRM
jgi:hypothetical protein